MAENESAPIALPRTVAKEYADSTPDPENAMLNLILSGGVAHDYVATSAIAADILDAVGIRSEVHEDFRLVESVILDFDIVTLNCARWTCRENPDWHAAWHFELSEGTRTALLAFLRQGGGLLALHAAPICFDDWPAYRQILGAWWEWGHSGHAPYGQHDIAVRTDKHPVVRGVNNFITKDEVYGFLRSADRIDALATTEWEGVNHPLLWVREYASGKVLYNALGHGVESFENPTFRLLLQRGALWAAGRLPDHSPICDHQHPDSPAD